MSINIKTGKT